MKDDDLLREIIESEKAKWFALHPRNQMITLEQYVGIHKDSPDWTLERQYNAVKLLSVCADLQALMIEGSVEFPDNPNTKCGIAGTTMGGFRPQSATAGAPKSAHKEGLAVDRYDPSGAIDTWLMNNPAILESFGIYIEHPVCTKGWSHWSIQSPPSGHHVFYP